MKYQNNYLKSAATKKQEIIIFWVLVSLKKYVYVQICRKKYVIKKLIW